MKKQKLSICIILIIVFSLISFNVYAETDYTVIDTAEKFMQIEASGNYKITADITVSSSIPEFSGKLIGEKPDGTKPKITITSLNSISTEDGGVIKVLKGGTVENIAVYADSTIVTRGKIGMIVGISNGGTISNCDNYASFSPTYDNVGGILGYTNSGKTVIENCNNYGNVSSNRHNIGGIIGCSEYNATGASTPVNTIINCHNYGNITAGGPIGGIAGSFYGEKIENCSNSGNISGSSPVGGIVGNIDCLVNKCFNSGNITGSAAIAAGIAGTTSNGNNSDVSLTNCYNSGNVSNTNASGNSCGISYMVGKSGASSTSTVSNNYNCGVVSGGRVLVETVAIKYPTTPAASNNYYLIRESGNGNSNNSTGISSEELKALSESSGFDNNIWKVYPDCSYDYPQLVGNFHRNVGETEALISKVTIKITDSDYGTVEINGNQIADGDCLYVNRESEITLFITPSSGNGKLSDILVDNVSTGIEETITAIQHRLEIRKNSVVTVVFKKAVLIPGITDSGELFNVSGEIEINGTKIESARLVMFATVQNTEDLSGYSLKEFGYILSRENNTPVIDGADCKKFTAENNINSKGQFGIAIYGEFIDELYNTNESLYVRSYAIYEISGSEEIYYGDVYEHQAEI